MVRPGLCRTHRGEKRPAQVDAVGNVGGRASLGLTGASIPARLRIFWPRRGPRGTTVRVQRKVMPGLSRAAIVEAAQAEMSSEGLTGA